MDDPRKDIVPDIDPYPIDFVDKAQEIEEQAQRVKVAVGIFAGVLYGLLARITFGIGTPTGLLNTLTFGFITFVPLGLGAMTVFFSSRKLRASYRYAIRAPLFASGIFLILTLLFSFEVLEGTYRIEPPHRTPFRRKRHFASFQYSPPDHALQQLRWAVDRCRHA